MTRIPRWPITVCVRWNQRRRIAHETFVADRRGASTDGGPEHPPAERPIVVGGKNTDGVVDNLTGVLAEVGIGAALLAVGFARRKQNC